VVGSVVGIRVDWRVFVGDTNSEVGKSRGVNEVSFGWQRGDEKVDCGKIEE
jgi:hypothetical protein